MSLQLPKYQQLTLSFRLPKRKHGVEKSLSKKHMKIRTLGIASVLALGITLAATPVHAQDQKIFTLEELAQYDGKDDSPAYYAYEGRIYDVTSSPLWKGGEHFGLEAGKDLSGEMEEAPHGIEVFVGFKEVGVLAGHEYLLTEIDDGSAIDHEPWYMGRIEFLGQSLLGWTGIVLGISFFLTFGTCYAMPWAKAHLPWLGSKPGPDPLDKAGTHMPVTTVHKYFVWYTIVFGIIHGIIGFLQMLGIYI